MGARPSSRILPRMRAAVTAGSLAAAGWSLPALAPLVPRAGRRAWACRARGAPPGAVAITFDDGPHPEGTPRVLELLRGARACARRSSSSASRSSATARCAAEIAAAGHAIALHGHRHRVLLRVPPGARRATTSPAGRGDRRGHRRRPALHRPPLGIYSLAGAGDRARARPGRRSCGRAGATTGAARHAAARRRRGRRTARVRRRAAAARRRPLLARATPGARRSRRCRACSS